MWDHSYIIISTAGIAPTLIGALNSLYPLDDGSQRDTSKPWLYGKPLSALGTDPATHYLCVFPATDAHVAAFNSANLSQAPGLGYWRTSSHDDTLVTTNVPGYDEQIGQPFTYQQALQGAGLAVIFPQGDF